MRLALLIRSACPGAGPRRGTWATLAFLLLLALLPGPAHADDIGATARGVVRALAGALGEPEEEVAEGGVWRVR